MCNNQSAQITFYAQMTSATRTDLSSTNTGGGQSHDHNLSANFVGTGNSVLQPYLVLIYIIKT